MSVTTTPVQAPARVRDAVWWHVYPIGFLGVDPTGVSRQGGRPLDSMCAWLDYIVAALNVDDQPRTVRLDAPFDNRLHVSSPPADPTVLEVPSHGWEVAF